MGLFGMLMDGRWGQKRPPIPKICNTYPTMMKLVTILSYLKKFKKIYESPETPLELKICAGTFSKSF